jgi:hypothetical protein
MFGWIKMVDGMNNTQEKLEENIFDGIFILTLLVL